MLSRAMARRAFFSTSIIVDDQTRTIAEALRYNSLVFVAQDGGFLCQTCVSSPCNEMLEATCDYDESELPVECRQWRIIGAQEPELGHGDTCDHCGKPTSVRDNDDWVDPWPRLNKLHRGSANLDPRWYGGDRDGPSDCDGEDA